VQDRGVSIFPFERAAEEGPERKEWKRRPRLKATVSHLKPFLKTAPKKVLGRVELIVILENNVVSEMTAETASGNPDALCINSPTTA
jgi:hypothetical protein